MWSDATYENPLWYARPFSENNNVDVDVWDQIVKFLGEQKFNVLLIDLGDAVKYETHPEIAAPDAWDKDFLKKKLDEIRAQGITPIPKLNFSCGHHTWLKEYNRMVSSPTYYRVCADLIGEVCELFGYPEYFHIGFDEEVERKQQFVEKVVVRGPKLWWNDLFFMAKECEKHGARPWMWSDYFWEPGNEDRFLKNMSKSILQSNWYYDSFQAWPEDHFKGYGFRIKTYEIFNEMGYDQVPTASTWQKVDNIRETCAFCKERLDPEHLKGIMVAPWVFTTDESKYRLMDEARKLYLGRREFFPETLK
jgi:hypothetical protein